MKLKTVLLTILLGVACFFTGCSSNGAKTVDQIKKDGKLVVTTNAEFAPFEFKEGTEIKGLDIDIIKAFGEYIGVEVEIKDIDFDSALLSVSTNKSDVAIAGITKNEKREQTLSFSNSYYAANQVVVVKEDSAYASLTTEAEILSLLTSSKATIGCQRGTTGEYYIEGDEDWGFSGIADTNCRTFDNGALAVNALANGQIDAVILDVAPANVYCEKTQGVKVLDVVLTEEEYAIAVDKGNDTLVAALNDFIAKIKEDGTFETIVTKYFGA